MNFIQEGPKRNRANVKNKLAGLAKRLKQKLDKKAKKAARWNSQANPT